MTTAPPGPPAPPDYPSMEVVWNQVQRYSKWLGDKFTSVEQLAGILIGASAVLVGLVRAIDNPNWIEIAGQFFAGTAAILALYSFTFRSAEFPANEKRLIEYAALRQQDSMGLLWRTELAERQKDTKLLAKKSKVLGIAALILVIGLALDIAGTAYRADNIGDPTPIPTPTVTVTTTPTQSATKSSEGDHDGEEPKNEEGGRGGEGSCGCVSISPRPGSDG